MFLDEAQAFCVSPPIPTGDIILGPGHATNVSHPRSAHVIPPDLPTWQWQGNIWRKEAEAHDSLVSFGSYQNEQRSAILVQ
ncbi:hypothetical protein G6F57_023454 [Rhizopus arrhizus]|uniref:Uncharacterized protein n=1 Tax=Rhizopus oryzae TaxID=64495 RepID=A0A9P7BHD9_RHIOR|nr:hypothetical protein G6F22_021762 [Rhizopus arrhizus]KAG1273598.1 hypothetical protein G6F64_015319 [Rhizopus arrhizus]KAG1372264.1 hypothetical protein G6F59_018594 [Rhizopus arrhizus]KAG1424292.1 hypothetical protein G6F57_023454 [Rhizopus arrhizus]